MTPPFCLILPLMSSFTHPPRKKGGWRVLLRPLGASNGDPHPLPGCTEGRSSSQGTWFRMCHVWRRQAGVSGDESTPTGSFPAAPHSLAVEVLLHPLPSPLPSHKLCCQHPVVQPRWALRETPWAGHWGDSSPTWYKPVLWCLKEFIIEEFQPLSSVSEEIILQ